MRGGNRTIRLAVAVVCVVLLLAAITICRLDVSNWRVGGTLEHARVVWVQADLQAIRIQLQQYKAANGGYPSTEQGLTALVIEPTSPPIPSHWKKLLAELPKDPWQNDYVYRCPGRMHPDGYDLFSAGPDGTPYTADDDWAK